MEEKQQQKMNWVDIEENEGEEDTYLPPPEITEDDKTGIKTVVEYRLEPNGQKVKVTSKFRVVSKTKKVSKKVAERSSWKKFGGSRSDAQTIVSRDEIRIEDPKEGDEAEKRQNDAMLLRLAQKMQETKELRQLQSKSGSDSRKGGLYDPSLADKMKEGGGETIGGAPGKYVAPGMRGGGGGGREERDDSNTLRVTNISEDASERDLQELFKRFGPISRIFLAKDKETGQSRGFAYVTYIRREDAQSAMNALDGYGYDHLILKVEWAEKSNKEKEDVGSQSIIGKHMSGYGRALPQG
jgi:translation initiation factor 3 subunit G